MKPHWIKCQLGDIVTFQRGYDLPRSKMAGYGYPVVGSNGIIGFHNAYTTKSPAVSVGRSGNVGKPFIVYGNAWTHNTALFIKEFKNSDPVFVYYYLKTLDLGNYAGGSAVPTLNRNHIHALPVCVPASVREQQAIASVLKTFDDKIELNTRINDNLEQQAQAMFTSWFVNYDVFDEPFCKSPIGTFIPESLKMVQIASLQPILETGKRPKGGAASIGIPSIGAENVKKLGEVNLSSNKFIPFEFASKLKTGKVNGYELMLYKDGGKPGTFTPHFSIFGEGFPYDEFYINEHVFKLDFGNRGFNEFAYFYFQTEYPYNWLANNGGKAAIPGINRQDINSIWIYSPEHPIVKRYCEWVEPIFTTVLSNCAQNVKLAAIRDTLLPRLMSGELDVSKIPLAGAGISW